MRTESKPVTPWGNWVLNAMKRRGFNQPDLAEASGIRQNTISTWLTTDRIPERPNVEKAAIALAPEGADDDIVRGLINEAMQAAFGYDDHEVIDFLRGQPDHIKDRAKAILEAAFGEEDTKDREGTVGGKKAE
jgi:transcriptional regulator with XRE-family HTH domain